MASRDPIDLTPELQLIYAEFAKRAKQAGVDFILTCTHRSGAEQDELYTHGRTAPGPVLTHARAGESAHNFMPARAFDVVPMRLGKCMWDAAAPEWQVLGKIGQDLGLNWYGKPGAPFHEMPHFEVSHG